MLTTMVNHQRYWMRCMVFKRVAEDFEDDCPPSINTARMEEEAGADIEYLYGQRGEKIYRMLIEVYGVINTSRDPFNDPAVDSVLEKYEYYISPSGRHIYGAGPKFK